jgi:hypothetical protein
VLEFDDGAPSEATAALLYDNGEQAATAMLQRVLGEQPEGLERVTDLLRRATDAAPWAVSRNLHDDDEQPSLDDRP